jgi:hypothetical protein
VVIWNRVKKNKKRMLKILYIISTGILVYITPEILTNYNIYIGTTTKEYFNVLLIVILFSILYLLLKSPSISSKIKGPIEIRTQIKKLLEIISI